MKVALILVLALIVGAKTTQKSLSPIISGKDAKRGQFPYQAYLSLYGKISSACGGVLLSQWYVVTAAHCAFE